MSTRPHDRRVPFCRRDGVPGRQPVRRDRHVLRQPGCPEPRPAPVVSRCDLPRPARPRIRRGLPSRPAGRRANRSLVRPLTRSAPPSGRPAQADDAREQDRADGDSVLRTSRPGTHRLSLRHGAQDDHYSRRAQEVLDASLVSLPADATRGRFATRCSRGGRSRRSTSSRRTSRTRSRGRPPARASGHSHASPPAEPSVLPVSGGRVA